MKEPWQDENEICESFFQGMKINSETQWTCGTDNRKWTLVFTEVQIQHGLSIVKCCGMVDFPCLFIDFPRLFTAYIKETSMNHNHKLR